MNKNIPIKQEQMETLSKLASILELPSNYYSSIEKVAEYYGVDAELIKTVTIENQNYLGKNIKKDSSGSISYSPRGILDVGLYILADSGLSDLLKMILILSDSGIINQRSNQSQNVTSLIN